MEKKRSVFKTEYIYSFLLPIFFVLIAFAVSGIYPFGAKDILSCDLKEQYFDITAAFFNKIKHGGNIFVLNETRTGLNLYVMAAFLLFSPFNILFLFFDISAYPYLYELIYILKIGCAGLSACIFFNKSRIIDVGALVCTAFSVLYALGLFNIICSINIMWLDNIILLPICFLGIEYLSEKERISYFTAAYFMCVFTCYYQAYITGIVSFIYLIYYSVVSKKINFLKTTLLLLTSGILALLLAGFVTVPSAVGLYSGYTDKIEVISQKSFIRYGIDEICRAFLSVENGSPVIKTTLNIYIGIMPLYITVLYIISKNISKRERFAATLISLFFLLAFLIRPLYILIHFLREPASFDGRFIYGAALMFIIFSARYITQNENSQKKFCIAAALLFFICVFIADFGNINTYYIKFAVWVCVLAVVYSLLFSRVKNKALVMLFFACAESLVISVSGMYIIDKYVGHEKNGQYTDYIKKVKQLSQNINDNGFYRAYDICTPTRMSNVSAGFYAIDCFSSTVNEKATGFMKKTGIHVISDDKYISGIDNGIANESIFNVKYIMLTDKSGKFEDINGRGSYLPDGARLTSDIYKKIYEDENSLIFENTAALPLMFAADEKLNNISKEFYPEGVISGYFLNQEMFLNAAAGTDENLYHAYYDIGEPVTQNCTLISDGVTNRLKLSNSGEGTAEYRFIAEADGEYCIEFYVANKELSQSFGSYILTVNGATVNHEYLKNNIAKDIGYYKKGDIIEASITAYADEIEFTEPCIAKLDTKKFKQLTSKIQDNALSNIKIENDDICAESNFSSDRFIFTTIGFDNGYKVYIDGKETENISACDAMLGFYIPAGSHNVRITYISSGFKTGVYISIFSFSFVLGYFLIKKRRIKRPLS